MAIASIIKYEGGNDTFVWKHPCEDFNTATQLVVHESQEAVFFKDGVAYDSFGPGRYTLIADNLPRLRTVIGSLFGGADKTPFHCEVYFVNKVDVMTNKWHTNHSIPVQDPMYKILLDVNASGQYGIKIENAKLFLTKLMGTTQTFTTATLNEYFSSLLITRIKDYLAKTMAWRRSRSSRSTPSSTPSANPSGSSSSTSSSPMASSSSISSWTPSTSPTTAWATRSSRRPSPRRPR
jgi:membrane protease subunit (stomatin/prohibitin family)